MKDGFSPVDPQAVLAQVAELPLASWTYKKDDGAIRHIGPMAEDFHAAFGLGADDRYISDSDTVGVALAAIQGLNQVVEQKDQRIVKLESRLEELESLVRELASDR
jgi:hypothetical protein